MENRTMGRYSTMVAKQRKQLRRMSKYLRVYLQDEVWGWAQLVNRGWNGDAIKEGGWGHRWCGGIYGVSARWNLSGVVGWTYSVRDTDARRCPLTVRLLQKNSCCHILNVKKNKNCTVLGKNFALSSAKYWAESHGLSHGLWLWKTEARARGQVKPSSWLGFGLAYTAWLGLAPGFQAKPAHH